MKIRCELRVNDSVRKPYLVGGPSEPDDHLAHRLAAFILFWDLDPILDAALKHPALANYEFVPDLMALDDAGDIVLWVECGTVTHHKLTKITRRSPRARIVIMKENERAAAALRKELDEQFDRPERVEILAWPERTYKDWHAAVADRDRAEAFGEASGHMINAVLNDVPMLVEFKSF